MIKRILFQGYILQYHKSNNVIHHYYKLKDKNHMIILIYAEKAFDKIQHPFMIITLQKAGYRGNIPQHNKSYIWQTHSKHYPQWWKIESISPKSGTRHRCPLSPLLFNIVLEVLATAIRAEKERKGIQIRKEEVKLSLFADDTILYIEKRFLYSQTNTKVGLRVPSRFL